MASLGRVRTGTRLSQRPSQDQEVGGHRKRRSSAAAAVLPTGKWNRIWIVYTECHAKRRPHMWDTPLMLTLMMAGAFPACLLVVVVRQVSYIFSPNIFLTFSLFKSSHVPGIQRRRKSEASWLCDCPESSHTHAHSPIKPHTHFHIFIIFRQRRCHRHFLRFRNFIAGQHFAPIFATACARYVPCQPSTDQALRRTPYVIASLRGTLITNSTHTVHTHVSLLACLTCRPRRRRCCHRFLLFFLILLTEAAASSPASSASHTLIMASWSLGPCLTPEQLLP